MTRNGPRAALAAGAMALALICSAVSAGASPANGIGAPGVGDRFFPDAGNGGYRVSHYDLTLAWNPHTNVLNGDAAIDARTTQRLTQFDLDLRGLHVSSVRVNGNTAGFTRRGQELVIKPAHALANNTSMRVDVRYAGQPKFIADPDGSPDGWIRTDDGGVVALGEPQGAPTWFPANDHPSNKATFTVSMTVPNGLEVIGNGLPDSPTTHGKLTTHVWRERHPMATYLATIAIGDFTVTRSKTSSGIPIINAVDPKVASTSGAVADVNRVITWESSLFGPYPFESVGAISVDVPEVGYSLETQTRPTFTFGVNDDLLVHELSHQWFGDSVSVQTWPEIWLNEGFATYAEWLWAEHIGANTVRQSFLDDYNSTPADAPFWNTPPGPMALPGPKDLFGAPEYDRGAMTLEALRVTIGDTAFFRVLREWVKQHSYGNGATTQFIALAEHVSHRNLGALFHAWLETPSRPALPPSLRGVSSVTPAIRMAHHATARHARR